MGDKTISLHVIWAMVGLTSLLIITGGLLGMFRPDSATQIVGLAAIATPVLMGLMQLMRMSQMHSENQTQIQDNTTKTEEIRTIVNGEREGMLAQIEQMKERERKADQIVEHLKEQVRTLTDAASKIDSVVVERAAQSRVVVTSDPDVPGSKT